MSSTFINCLLDKIQNFKFLFSKIFVIKVLICNRKSIKIITHKIKTTVSTGHTSACSGQIINAQQLHDLRSIHSEQTCQPPPTPIPLKTHDNHHVAKQQRGSVQSDQGYGSFASQQGQQPIRFDNRNLHLTSNRRASDPAHPIANSLRVS